MKQPDPNQVIVEPVLTVTELNTILEALSAMPFNRVEILINNLRKVGITAWEKAQHAPEARAAE